MDESNKVLILSFLTMTSYFSALMLILKSRLQIDELPVYRRREKTDGAVGEVAKRLQKLMNELDEDAERAEKLSVVTGKGIGIVQGLKRGVIVAFSSQQITATFIWTMIFVTVMMFVVTVLTIKAFSNLHAILLLIAMMSLTLSTLNILSARRLLKLDIQVLEMMHLNFFHYTNSSNFEESVKKSLSALNPATKPYEILTNYMDKIYGLNMDPTLAIHSMKNEFGNIPSMNQYLETVVKAETKDTSYKRSLAGIPPYFGQLVAQRKDFTSSLLLVFAVCFAMGIFIIGSVMKVAIFGSNIEVYNAYGELMYLIGFTIYALVQVVYFYVTLRKPEKRWN